MSENRARQQDVQIPWHAMSVSAVAEDLQCGMDGLSDAEVVQRRARYGVNALPVERGDGPLLLIWRQINTPIGWLLLVAGTMALLLGKRSDALVVFGAVVINALIGFVQEYRAGRTIEALSALVPRLATVFRDGAARQLPVEELVPGDLISLQSGDQVPADVRLVNVHNLQVDEASLTGESLASVKRTEPVAAAAQLGDRFSMVYSGTMVVQGTASGIVVATGAATELGTINALLAKAAPLETPLTRQLARVSTIITGVVVLLVGVLLLVGIYVKHAPPGEALMVAISLAAAAIPEGLPSVITIALAIGVRRMAERHAVIRHLPAVETLGSTTVICTDKTGTLTRNEMTLQVAWLAGREYRFSGVGYEPVGDLEHDGQRLHAIPDELEQLLVSAVLCSDATLQKGDGGWDITGDPTEAALVVALRKAGYDEQRIRGRFPRCDVVPFESETRYMAVLTEQSDRQRRLVVKGAPETVAARCVLSLQQLADMTEALATYARQGLRVLACAWQDVPAASGDVVADLNGALKFGGLLGMIDPPRSEAVDAVHRCQKAGITVKMITGDHPATAEAIGRQIGLLRDGSRAVTGDELDTMDDLAWQQTAASTTVFARVSPEHKIRLVQTLQGQGEVVAMTGDGVNDAPALKQADIGVAMGITGTAVAKDAARVILVDDNFASITAAVEEGRRVYDNLIKSLAFVLPANLGLAATLSGAVLLFPAVVVDGRNELLLAMSPSQTLWINLVASVTLSVPLAFEPLEQGAMNRSPRSPDAPVFSKSLLVRLVLVALVMAAAACGLFLVEYFRIVGHDGTVMVSHLAAVAEAQTSCVTAITWAQIWYLFSCRSRKASFLSQGAFSNPALYVGILLLLALQGCFVYLPPLQRLFGTVALDGEAWLHAALAGALVMPVVAAEKLFHARGIPQ